MDGTWIVVYQNGDSWEVEQEKTTQITKTNIYIWNNLHSVIMHNKIRNKYK